MNNCNSEQKLQEGAPPFQSVRRDILTRRKRQCYAGVFVYALIWNDRTIIARSVKPRASEYSDIVSILNTDRVFAHNEKLKRALRFKAKPSIIEKTIIDESLKPIRERINSVLPGQFEFSQEGNYYVHSGMKLSRSEKMVYSRRFM